VNQSQPPLKKSRLVKVLICMAGAFLVGVAAGHFATGSGLRDRLVKALHRYTGKSGSAATTPDSLTAAWVPLPENLHALEMASIKLSPFETKGRGGALEQIDGNILFASPLGVLGYLTPNLELRLINTRVPLHFDEFEKTDVYKNPSFSSLTYRVLDLLVVRTGPGTADLYASHHRFTGKCFEVVVSKTSLTVDAGNIKPAADGWEEVFVAKPCVPPKNTADLYSGNEAGGRMAMVNGKLWLVLGDLQFNGVDDPTAYSQDPAADYGKLVEIDPRTHQSKILASGMRNPQGLYVAADGTVWETEHGPQGGDEINILRAGANYGWPLVTYGVNYSYGGPRRDWTMSKNQGRHDGFDKPVYAFVPSIGISNVIAPDTSEFPLWRDHLLVGSLTGHTLYLVRVEDGHKVEYAEPLAVNSSVRDMLSLPDGRVAILSDEGNLLLIRNAELAKQRHPDQSGNLQVHASAEVVAAAVKASAIQPIDFGQQMFGYNCNVCHSLTGSLGVGPPLNGVIGRRVGSVAGYHYSPALSGRTEAWTGKSLRKFLKERGGEQYAASPMFVMFKTELPDDQIAALAEFLSRTAASNQAAPPAH
jgi:cytochrome c2